MTTRPGRAAAILALVGLALSAHSAAAGTQGAQPVTFRTFRGQERFLVSNIDAAKVAASRLNDDRAENGVTPAPTAGYEFTGRVVVRASTPAAIGKAIAGVRGVTMAPSAANGFWVVTAPSVRAAAKLADTLAADPAVAEAYMDAVNPRVLRDAPTDPFYYLQWHLNNGIKPEADVNAQPAWDAGWIGEGVTVGILEGGWQYTHPDLAANYNADATQSGGSATSHGTACAGVAAAVADNGRGGVGVAWGARVSGQIYGSSSQTASAFKFRNDLNAIKSNSWGPSDDGTISYMPSVERAAIEEAIATGRDGKGTVFVWAGGNGGTGDRNDYDPYVSSRYTLCIGAVGDQDRRSYYNESGSSMLVVTCSDGNDRGIYTTSSGSGYTSSFGGTSSASPLAAGLVALLLDANPDLTWRDVQQVLVHSARKCDPAHAAWVKNGAGLDINYNYGYGAIDAYAACQLASGWTTVAPEIVGDTGVVPVAQQLPDNDPAGLTFTQNVADDIKCEAVELIVNITTTNVGDLRIVLTSPSGTESLLADRRSDTQDNYTNYIFTSRRNYDENAKGDWTINISDRRAGTLATWGDYRLKVYGTSIKPCPVDFNGDGKLDVNDFIAFQGSWKTRSSQSDWNHDGAYTVNDFVAFQADFIKGCP